MNTSHLGRAVAFICRERDTTQTEIAANAGLSQVVLSRACNGTRPEVKTLKALCTSQPDHRDNIDLLVAHLRDEIERAGHSTHEIEVTATASRLDDDLRLLLEEATHDEQLAGMLRQLAAFVRTHPLQPAEEPLAFAAEQQAPYDATPPPARDPLKDALRRRAAEGDLDDPTVVDIKIKAEDVTRRVAVLNEAQLRERMTTVRSWRDPLWLIHVPEAETKQLADMRRLGPTVAQKKWERDHKDFGNFVRNRISDGARGRTSDPQTFHFSPLEFIALNLDPTARWTAAMRNWAGQEPGAVVRASLAAAANTSTVVEEPTPAQRTHAERARVAGAAWQALIAGTATAHDRDTLRAFILAMK